MPSIKLCMSHFSGISAMYRVPPATTDGEVTGSTHLSFSIRGGIGWYMLKKSDESLHIDFKIKKKKRAFCVWENFEEYGSGVCAPRKNIAIKKIKNMKGSLFLCIIEPCSVSVVEWGNESSPLCYFSFSFFFCYRCILSKKSLLNTSEFRLAEGSFLTISKFWSKTQNFEIKFK